MASGSPSIYLAIGTGDSLYGANRMFRRFLEAERADFFREDGPGVHNRTFWNEYINRGPPGCCAERGGAGMAGFRWGKSARPA